MTSQVLLSNWSKNAKSLPKQYILPPESRLRDIGAPVPEANAIPVIDLSRECSTATIQQIMKACQELGAFQVINHGVPEKLMDEAMKVSEEFFEMPAEDKEELFSNELIKGCRLYTSGLFYSDTIVNCWKDSLLLPCFPLDQHISSWPTKPSKFREVMKRYSEEVKKLQMRIMDMICQGLGLKLGYFNGELSETQNMLINYYPPCPEPSLAVGVPSHTDKNLITFLQQREYGLQVSKDEEWFGVEPIPHAFVVNVADQLEVISNGRLVSGSHRAVTNSNVTRTSLVTFIISRDGCKIEPAKELISETSPAKFGSAIGNQYASYANENNPKNPLPKTSLDS